MTELARLRDRIDVLDAEIIERLAQRFEVCRLVGRLKSEESIPMMQYDRVEHVHRHYREDGAAQGMPATFAQAFTTLLLASTCSLEDEIIDARGAVR
jgi:chorismate mutase